MQKATVMADHGDIVKLHKEPSTEADLIAKIIVGTEVKIIDRHGEWSLINDGDVTGYMMNQFLLTDDNGSDQQITINRSEVEEMHNKLGDWLGLKE